MSNIERGFKGVWIPAELWLDENLSKIEMLFLTDIDSLDNKDGCFAGNEYFAKFFRLSISRCSEIISSLKDKGYIKIHYEYEGKQITKRIMRCAIKYKNQPPLRKTEAKKLATPSENRKTPSENTKDINTFNNTEEPPNSDEFGHDNDKIETDLYKPLIPNDHYTKIDEESFKNIPTPEIITFEELAKETELFNMSNNLDNFADKITDKKGIKSDTDINNQINSDNIPNSCKKIKEPDSLDELIKFWNDEMRENIIISKKNRGSIYGIIKVQSLDRLKKAITQAKKQIETKKGIRYTFGSIIYKDSNISNLCAQYDKDDPYKDLPESTRKKLEEMRRKK